MSLGLPAYLEDRISPEPNSGCWLWTGGGTGRYGVLWVRKAGDKKAREIKAHRAVFEYAKGIIPKPLELDHLCRNRYCVNPDHLEAVTHQVNVQRGEAGRYPRKLLSECFRGHPYSEENTYWNKGKRHCRSCHPIHRRNYYLRNGK